MHHQNVDFLLKTIDDNNARILPNRAKALAMIGIQIDAVMRKKEMTSKRPTTDSPTGYLRPAKYA